MELVAIAIFGSAVALAAAEIAVTLERRMDVLYGAYIEGQAIEKTIKQKLLALASSFADRLRWQPYNASTSVVAG